MALPGSGTISLEAIRAEFVGGYPISLSQYYRNGGLVTSNNTNVPTGGTISLSQFYGAQKLIYFPDSFYWQAYITDGYGPRYVRGSVSISHLNAATFGGDVEFYPLQGWGSGLNSYSNPNGIGTTTNSQGAACEYFYSNWDVIRGCQNGNNQEWWFTVLTRALPGSYETYITSFASSQWGC